MICEICVVCIFFVTIQHEVQKSPDGEGWERRIKIRQMLYFDPLILTFSRREKELDPF
jgi:hypothetical protein